MPEEFVPPVVAVVVVTGEAGSSLEVCLESLARQDYTALDVLVVDASTNDGVTSRIAKVLPGAIVRREEGRRAFGSCANQALTGIEGASFFLFCSPDTAFDPDAVRLLVQEAFRSNASVVGPKLVDWDRPDRLLEVGLGVDRFGAVLPRVEEGELDQEQHDEFRAVFAVPTAGMLVRADIFAAVQGFDGDLESGEDVDLCWRVHLAGARVTVAPQARARWKRPRAAVRHSADALTRDRVAQLRSVLKNYGLARRTVALLIYVLLAIVDTLAAPVTGSKDRAHSRREAIRWNLVHYKTLSALRQVGKDVRQVSDRHVVGLMGSRGVFRRVGRPASAHAVGSRWAGAGSRTTRPAGSVRASGEGDRLTDLIVRLQHGDVATAPAMTVLLMVLLALIGLRSLLFSPLPVIGQLVPGPTGWRLVEMYANGVTTPGWHGPQIVSPAYFIVGLVATVLGNSYGLAVKFFFLSGLVAGGFGTARLLRDLTGVRSRLVAVAVFAASPIVWNGLAHGDLQGEVALAVTPWVMLRLARASGSKPFDAGANNDIGGNDSGDVSSGSGTVSSGSGTGGDRWALRSLAGEMAPLGLLLALAVSLAPAYVIDYLVLVVAGVFVSVVTGDRSELKRSGHLLLVAAGGAVVAFVCCLPWSLTVLSGGGQVSLWSGSVPPSGHGYDPAELLRGFTGPVGHWWGAFGLVAAAFAVLLWARRPTLDWAARWLVTALLAVVAAWLGSQGFLGSGFGNAEVLVAPLAVGVAAACGLGVTAFADDVSRHRFGWRQLSGGLALVCAVAGMLPVLGFLPGGSAGLPASGFESSSSELVAPASTGYHVLWLGDARTIPGASWPVSRNLGAVVTAGGLPSFSNLYPPVGIGADSALRALVLAAQSRRTLQLGSLLAPYGIRDIVVPTATAPVLPGVQSPPLAVLPGGLIASLQAQTDLTELPEEGGVLVFQNVDWAPASGSGLVAGSAAGASGRSLGVVVALLVTLLALAEGVVRRRRRRRKRPAPPGEPEVVNHDKVTEAEPEEVAVT